MRKFFITLFLAISTVVIGWISTAPASASDLKTIAAATFKLYEGDQGMCSVTFLKNDTDGAMFLTAAHCINGSTGLNLRRQVLAPDMKTVLSEQVFYVKPIRTLTKKDVAIIQVKDKNITFSEASVDIATPEEAANVDFGDPVMVIGYPAGGILAVTKGEFTGIIPQPFGEAFENDLTMYQTTAPVAGGNSGGGLYAQIDGTWKLIGTTTGARRDNSIMTFYQTADTIKVVLTGYVK